MGKRALHDWLPVLGWARRYDAATLHADLVAAAIVTLLLIPQGLAYAQLAGLPPQAGLYASILPLAVYALLGSSSTLSVGPFAVTSLITASALGGVAAAGSAPYATAALTLALLSGALLLVAGALRMGWIANFLSHPVITGFVSASAVLIVTSQVAPLLGARIQGQTLVDMLPALARALPQVHGPTVAIGALTLAWLWWTRTHLGGVLRRLGLSMHAATLAVRVAPLAAIVAAVAAVAGLQLGAAGVPLVGAIPRGLPGPTLPSFDPALLRELALPAVLLGLVTYASSVSVAQTLAARRRERIEPDQELRALGAGNVAAAFSGGLPVAGGLSRSVVAFDAGARTPATGAFTAVGIAAAALALTPLLALLPQATLAAMIVAAAASMVDVEAAQRLWRYSKADFAALAVTFVGVLAVGVEAGLLAGALLSVLQHLARTSRPHVAVVGWVPGTEHFRNVERHAVRTSERLLSLRVDETLYFANARPIEDRLNAAVASMPRLEHVVLQCSAVNDVDASAVESLEAIAERLRESGIALHLSEVKGPVMDKLQRSTLLHRLGSPVWLTHFQAVRALTPEVFDDGMARS